jgi:hypothetical protein
MGPWEVIVEINGEKEPCLIQDIEDVLVYAPGRESEGGSVTLKDGAEGEIDGYYILQVMKYEPNLIRYHPMGVWLQTL